MSRPIEISIVVPVYRSAAILPALVKRVREALSAKYDEFELILVNDCSPDESWKVIADLSEKNSFIVGIDLRKNVGQDNAIMAGLNHAHGNVIIIMDDDLQHRPEDIHLLNEKISQGYDVCYAHFPSKKQAWWKNAGSWFNGKLASWVIGKPSHIYLSPFKAITKGVVVEMLKYKGPFAYIDGLIWTITSRCTQVPIEHFARAEGDGNYNLVRSIRVWLKLFTGFSVKPLRIITLTGFITSSLSFILGVVFIIAHFLESFPVEGWASLFVSILFLGGIQLTCLGMLGEYIGRTYLRLSDQPQYSVRQSRGYTKVADQFYSEGEDPF